MLIGDPSLVSSRTKDIYEDILEDRRYTSDIAWSMRSRDLPVYHDYTPRNAKQLREHVMSSDRVKYAVEQVLIVSSSEVYQSKYIRL